MGRSILLAILVLAFVHLLAAGGFVGYLASTERLSKDRLERAVAIFRPTIPEEAAAAVEAEALNAQARSIAERAAYLESVADGPRTLRDRLAADHVADEVTLHRLERLNRETEDLRRQIERAQDLLARQKRQLDADRAAFDAFVEETTRQMQDEDFQQAVRMYDQLRPRQAKEMLQTLLEQGQDEQVVAYLAAMQLRKATKVLQEFKGPGEIEQAARLIEQLRLRGIYTDSNAMAEANP